MIQLSTKKLLETISKFSKVAGCKINAQNPTAFLYTNNETSEKVMKKIPFATATNRIKYVGINIGKDVKDLYTENYTAFLKKKKKYNKMKRYSMFMDWKNQHS